MLFVLSYSSFSLYGSDIVFLFSHSILTLQKCTELAFYLAKSSLLQFFERNLFVWRELQRKSDLLSKSSFSYVTISSFKQQHERHFFEIFKYGGMHLKADYVKLGVSSPTPKKLFLFFGEKNACIMGWSFQKKKTNKQNKKPHGNNFL